MVRYSRFLFAELWPDIVPLKPTFRIFLFYGKFYSNWVDIVSQYHKLSCKHFIDQWYRYSSLYTWLNAHRKWESEEFRRINYFIETTCCLWSQVVVIIVIVMFILPCTSKSSSEWDLKSDYFNVKEYHHFANRYFDSVFWCYLPHQLGLTLTLPSTPAYFITI